MQSHSFQVKKFKLHRNVDDSSGQVVEGFTILPYPQRGQKWRVNHSKNVISTCNRTVFKLRSSNFTVTSTTPRDRSWRGSQFYRTPRGVRNRRVNHSKNVISTCNRTVFKLRSSNFTVTSTTPRDRSWRGSRFYRTPRGVRNKGLITQKRYFDVQSHSFQDKKFKLHRNVDDSSGQVVEGFTILSYLQRGQK